MILLTPLAGVTQTVVEFNLATAPTFVADNGTMELLGDIVLTADATCGNSSDGFCVGMAGNLNASWIPVSLNDLSSGIQVCESIGGVTKCNGAGSYLSGSFISLSQAIIIGVKSGIDLAAGDQISITGVRVSMAASCPSGCPGQEIYVTMTASPSTIASFSPTSQIVARAFASQSAIERVSGNSQSGTAGTQLAAPFIVEVTAPMGGPAAGVSVTFAVQSGGGSLSVTDVVTSGDGRASTTLTLGPTPGPHLVTATSVGIPGSPVSFVATGILRLSLESGNNQTGLVGTTLASPLMVKASGFLGVPVAGIPIDFAVTSGAGSFSTPSQVTTSAQGLASATLMLGVTAGSVTVEASSANVPGVNVVFTLTATTEISGPTPTIRSGGVMNGASLRDASGSEGAVAGGTVVSISGSDLAADQRIVFELPLSTVLGETSVTFNNIEAPLYSVSPSHIMAQLPFGLPIGEVEVAVHRGSKSSVPLSIIVAAASPGIFTLNGEGHGPGMILHVDSSQLVTATNPAQLGESLAVYCTGLGPVNPPVSPGEPTPGPAPETIATPLATLAGIPAEVSFSGLAPGYVGLYLVIVRVPAGISPGVQDLQLIADGVASNKVTVAVQ